MLACGRPRTTTLIRDRTDRGLPVFPILPHSSKEIFKGVPLLQEAVWTAKYLTNRSVAPFNGRWQQLRAWLAELDRFPEPVAVPRRVLAFASSPRWLDYLLALCVVLIRRGCRVDFLWLPYTDNLPHERSEAIRFERWSGRFAPPEHPRLRLINLLDVAPAEATPAMQHLAEDIADFDTCYLNGKETREPETCLADREVFAFRSQRNLDCLRRLETFLRDRSYDSALTGNGRFMEYGCFHSWCRRFGLPCVSLDTFEVNNQIVASQKEPSINWNTDDIWRADEPHFLSAQRRQRVQERLAKREDPALQEDLAVKTQLARPETACQLQAKLKLDPAKPLALLCTNLAWDSAVLRQARTFPTMRQWYLESIAWFARRPDWQLVVRTHPIEAQVEQPKSVADYIDEAFPQLPENVRLVRPADPVNTYGIMRLAAFGIVFTSTVGLEMAVRGLRVITVGKTHYARRGFTIDPDTPQEYFASLEAAMREPAARLPREQVDRAWCYFDTYFQHFPKILPWRLVALREDLQSWPMARILAGDCPEAFLKSFDYLAGRQVPGLL